jgi:hypothetical protein
MNLDDSKEFVRKLAGSNVWQCERCERQCVTVFAHQCAAVFFVVYGRVRLSGSTALRSTVVCGGSVRQCGSAYMCGRTAVCGRAAVCDSARTQLCAAAQCAWPCATTVCSSVWQ